MMTTGFIGLGDMGAPIAHRLLDGSIELVVFDVRAEAARSLAERGATVATDPAELAKQCELIFVCVVSDEQVLAVADSVRESMGPGGVLVIISSVLPVTVRAIAAMFEPRGVAVIDAPVTGSRPAAAAGTLTVIVGGDEDVVASITPALNTFAGKIVHVGGAGMAQAVKISNNVMLHMNHLIALEAVQFARAHGVSEETLIEVANAGTGRSWVTETWGLIDGMFIDHPQAGTDGIYDMMVKEMWNAVVLSKTAHIAVPLTSLGVQVSRGMLERRAVDIEAAVT
jgi:3-hydroxyisobutyrate dehydrogenase